MSFLWIALRRGQGSEDLPLLSWRRPSAQTTWGIFALGIKPLAPKPGGMVQIPPLHTPGQGDFALRLVERAVLCTRLCGRRGASAGLRIGSPGYGPWLCL